MAVGGGPGKVFMPIGGGVGPGPGVAVPRVITVLIGSSSIFIFVSMPSGRILPLSLLPLLTLDIYALSGSTISLPTFSTSSSMSFVWSSVSLTLFTPLPGATIGA